LGKKTFSLNEKYDKFQIAADRLFYKRKRQSEIRRTFFTVIRKPLCSESPLAVK
jgi:hypothetical protein